VTQVRFQPSINSDGSLNGTTTQLLVSGAEDGLVCIHDTKQPTEDTALQTVLNIQAPLRNVGFFGPSGEGIFCLTGNESMSVWHHDSAQKICDFGDARKNLSDSANFPIQYLVGCHWDGSQLSLMAGNCDGNGAIFRVDAGTISLTHTMIGGHRGCIRSFTGSPSSFSKVDSLITGGEDARLCEWKSIDYELEKKSEARKMSYKLSEGKPQTGGGPTRRAKKSFTNTPY